MFNFQRKLYFILVLFFNLLFNVILCFSNVSYISEVNFIGDEYVEIYSDSFLNLSKEVIIDESLKNNSLELLKFVNGSNYYLVVGNNFVKNYVGVDLLNCSIYKTDKSQVSNGGLKSSGESFLIGNLSFNLSNIEDNTFNFKDFESLIFINNTWVKSSKSICGPNILFNKSSDILPDEKSNENISCGNYNFDIVVNDDIFEDKLKFKFSSNYSSGNYLVNYWIENFKGNYVKGMRNTTSFGWKYYTPKGSTQILKILGELNFLNCSIQSEKYVYYYSDYVKTNTIVKTQNSQISNGDDLVKESYVKLLNINSLVNGSEDYLDYEIYRGDNRKSVVNFYLNSKIILKQRLDEFENLSGRVYIGNSDLKYDYLKVVGLDVNKRYNFITNVSVFGENGLKNVKYINLTKKVNQFYKISNFNIDLNKIYFNISSNIVNLESYCYVNKVRTKVSNIVNVSIGVNSLDIDVNKFSNFENLKLLCKYKKIELKNFNYESVSFNFSKEYIPKLINDSISNFNILSNDVIKKEIKVKKKKTDLEQKELSLLTLNSNDVVYSNKNINFIETSIYFVFVGVLLFIIPLILFW